MLHGESFKILCRTRRSPVPASDVPFPHYQPVCVRTEQPYIAVNDQGPKCHNNVSNSYVEYTHRGMQVLTSTDFTGVVRTAAACVHRNPSAAGVLDYPRHRRHCLSA